MDDNDKLEDANEVTTSSRFCHLSLILLMLTLLAPAPNYWRASHFPPHTNKRTNIQKERPGSLVTVVPSTGDAASV